MNYESEKVQLAEETVGSIAVKDLRKADVFRKYGIDYCCGGKKTLQQACNERGIDKKQVEADLRIAEQYPVKGRPNDYSSWKADFLADYIYNFHHVYYYEESPVINALLDKVTAKHGAHSPELIAISTLFKTLSAELDSHFIKEEKVLFPFIKELVRGKTELPSISQPVLMMEKEHEDAGELLAQIRKLTNDYSPPPGSCNSFRLLYMKLEDLENDLHQHIHLENNILFPKAKQLQSVQSESYGSCSIK